LKTLKFDKHLRALFELQLSGDLLGAELIRVLKDSFKNLEILAVTGPNMREHGVASAGCIEELSMMGFSSVAKNILRLKIYEENIMHQVRNFNPDVCVLIDFPGLHFRLGKKLKQKNFKVIQFVAPKVWAWGQKRVKKFAGSFDKVFGVLPFEEDFFKKHHVDYHYIGSPHAKRLEQIGTKNLSELGNFDKWLSFLPGSRKSEIIGSKEALRYLDKSLPSNVGILIPVASNYSSEKISHLLEFKNQGNQSRVFFVHENQYEYMKSCDVAFATSGTVTLELALMGVPSVIFYQTSALKYFLGKKLLSVSYLGLPNLILDKSVFTEFIGPPDFDGILNELSALLFDDGKRGRVLADLQIIKKKLDIDPWSIFVDELKKVVG